jgi:hypothetical protein
VLALLLVGLEKSCGASEEEWQEMPDHEQGSPMQSPHQRLPIPLSKWMVNIKMNDEQTQKLTTLLLKIRDGYDRHAAVREWNEFQGSDTTAKPQQNAEWPWSAPTPSAAPTALPANYHGMPDPLNAPIVNPDLPGVVWYTGLTGTSLYATLDKPGGVLGYGCGPSARCACQSDEYLLYGSAVQLLLQADCFFENLSLRWDEDRQAISGVPGVKIRTKNGQTGFDPNGSGFGGPSCFTPDDGACFAWTAFQEALISNWNYSMAQFRTVVWDWRLGPNEWTAAPNDDDSLFETGNFAQWKTMYEELSAQTGQPSYIVSISEGGTIVKSFLENMDQSWKDQYIAGWFSYSGVFAGASDMAYSQMSGESFYTDMIKDANPLGFATFTPEEFRKATEALPGQAATSPIPTGDTEADNKVLFVTPSKNYTYAEYTMALRDAGLQTTASVMDSISATRPGFESPGVRMWCIYATEYPTPTQFVYSQDFDGVHSSEQPTIIHTGDGDGTVHTSSLAACNQWATSATETVGKHTTVHQFLNLSHTSIMGHYPAAELFAQELNSVLGTTISFLS